MKHLFLKNQILILSFSILFIVSCTPLKKYSEQVKVFEPEIMAFEQLDKTETYPNDAILFTGSSSIRLWSTIEEDVAPYNVIQRGFGGSRYSDLAWYIKRIAYPHQFQAVVIFEANDITGSEEDKTPEEVGKLAKYIVKTIREKYPTQPIFFVEVTPTKSRWQYWPLIQQSNNELKSLSSEKNNIYFIETAPEYLDGKGQPRTELFIKDQLHQNREGYVLWGKIIKQKLDEVLKQ